MQTNISLMSDFGETGPCLKEKLASCFHRQMLTAANCSDAKQPVSTAGLVMWLA